MKWNMISTGDIALRKGGSVDPKKHQDEVFELYSIPASDAGAPEVVAGSLIGSSKKAVEPNDVMISRIVPHIRRACVVGPAHGHRQIASGEWIIFRDERFWPKYLRWLLVGDVFHSAFMRTVSGVGGSLLRARPAEVFKIQIPLPPPTSRSGLQGFWMRQTPCGPSAARPSPTSTLSSNPPSSTCSATPSPIRWDGRSRGSTIGSIILTVAGVPSA